MLRGLSKRLRLPALLKYWTDGRLKMYVTWKLLNFRRSHSELFLQGEYIPLRVTGTRANHVIAFARRLDDKWCIVAVPRLNASLTRAGSPPLGEKIWHDTQIELPSDAPLRWENALTAEQSQSPLLVSAMFSTLPLFVSLSL
jgi:(1->4)-alpha-D-glucan 1-alpha-D-glucosylmutase